MWGARLSDVIGTFLFVRSARVISLSGIIVLIVLLFVADQWGYIPMEWLQSKGLLSKKYDTDNALLTLYLFGSISLTTIVALVMFGFAVNLAFITVMAIVVKVVQNNRSRLIKKLRLIEQDKVKSWTREQINIQSHMKSYWLQWNPEKREQW